ncbi:unnamed protein product [Blepharisma stoltei]|uniref:Peptidase S49 domain-containing protein n=1 Tax=Blepharisma stoltei TaxID=1481888 RepID=A0AAU9JLE5_9CILI|nr:unnamed protein product [Blepharisma stoltei]
MEAIKRISDLRKAVFKIRISGCISEKTLEKLNKDLQRKRWRSPVALAIVVNSPGGSAAQSSLIRQRLLAFSKHHHIPVYAFAEDLAASGGYYVMSAANELYATPASLIGSIGARFSLFGIKGLAAKYGIERRSWATSPLDLQERVDPLKELKPDTQKWLAGLVQETGEEFKNVIEESRKGKIKVENAKKDEVLYNGDIFTADESVKHGLIDKFGVCDEVMKEIFPKYEILDLSKVSKIQRIYQSIGAE